MTRRKKNTHEQSTKRGMAGSTCNHKPKGERQQNKPISTEEHIKGRKGRKEKGSGCVWGSKKRFHLCVSIGFINLATSQANPKLQMVVCVHVCMYVCVSLTSLTHSLPSSSFSHSDDKLTWFSTILLASVSENPTPLTISCITAQIKAKTRETAREST